MLTLPTEYLTLLSAFAPLFSKRLWKRVQLMLVGAILTPGKRTVTAILRVMGLSADQHFQNYHRVFNRAVWSSREVGRVLLHILINAFAAQGTIVLGLDDTIERRRGAKIKAKGIYRDPVRSSRSHLVKASGLRWLSLMLLAPIPWVQRVWALPFLTVLAPSERYYQGRTRGHKKLTDWGRQMLLQVRRWLPRRRIVVVADQSFAVIALLGRLAQLPNPIQMITPIRLDAALYEPAPARSPHQRGRPRKKGARLPTLKQVLLNPKTQWTTQSIHNWYGESQRTVEICSDTAVWYHSGQPAVPIRWVLIRDPKGKFRTRALLCTDPSLAPVQIVTWFVRRWQLEVTFQEARTHLGMETQRQWSDLAVVRETPAVLGLFSLVTLLAHQTATRDQVPIRQAAWYAKTRPTFADVIALVRNRLWDQHFCTLSADTEMVKIPRNLLFCLTETLNYVT